MTTRLPVPRRSTLPGRAALAALGLLALGGCVYEPLPPPPAPAPVVEVVPPPPGTALVWRRGHWRWNGFRYVWVPGHYVPLRA